MISTKFSGTSDYIHSWLQEKTEVIHHNPHRSNIDPQVWMRTSLPSDTARI